MKIIIDNKTDRPMHEAVDFVRSVILDGKISNNKTQYCYVTKWMGSKIVVYASKNDKSDKFIVDKLEE